MDKWLIGYFKSMSFWMSIAGVVLIRIVNPDAPASVYMIAGILAFVLFPYKGKL